MPGRKRSPGGCKCCGPRKCKNVCIVPTGSCSTHPGIPGASITLTDGTNTFNCTSTGMVASITWGSGGSLYTDGHYTDGYFTGGGGSGGAFSYDVVGGVVQSNLVLTDGGHDYTSSPTPVFTGGGTGSGAGASVAAQIQCCLANVPQGPYTLTVSATGFTTSTQTVTIGKSCSPISVQLTTTGICCAGCMIGVPTTMPLTDDNGSIALTYSATDRVWYGAYTFNGPINNGNLCNTISGSVAVIVEVGCNPNGTFTITYLFYTNEYNFPPTCCVGFGRTYLSPPSNSARIGPFGPYYIYYDTTDPYGPNIGLFHTVSQTVTPTSCYPLQLDFNGIPSYVGCLGKTIQVTGQAVATS